MMCVKEESSCDECEFFDLWGPRIRRIKMAGLNIHDSILW